jgi:hypothetical protein
MLLNELLKQNKHAQDQDEIIRLQNRDIQELKSELASLRALIAKPSTAATKGQ